MSIFEELLPIDKQVNTKTGAFLGNTNAITFTNIGKIFDCSKVIDLAEYRLIQKLKRDTLDKSNSKTRVTKDIDSEMCVQSLKQVLDKELILDILDSLGYEIYRDKVKLRVDERTASSKVYDNGLIIDFGSGWKGDIFDILTKDHDMNLPEAIEFVKKYIGG